MGSLRIRQADLPDARAGYAFRGRSEPVSECVSSEWFGGREQGSCHLGNLTTSSPHHSTEHAVSAEGLPPV